MLREAMPGSSTPVVPLAVPSRAVTVSARPGGGLLSPAVMSGDGSGGGGGGSGGGGEGKEGCGGGGDGGSGERDGLLVGAGGGFVSGEAWSRREQSQPESCGGGHEFSGRHWPYCSAARCTKQPKPAAVQQRGSQQLAYGGAQGGSAGGGGRGGGGGGGG
eukprot:scaffold24647_cov57-Phaeocystis_antarctica.AAC.2